ncbi:MAG TPA: hypothetical protein VE688_06470, partial [Gaiellaceae bacterium]|nr:hypothetical protein [Gaiellaceae bacterium]
MKSAAVLPLRDPELLELLADDPELLAFADAVASTRSAAPAVRPRRRRFAVLAAAALLLGAAVAIAVALTIPWSHNPSLVDRALAAVGEQPVLHV